MLRFLFGFLLGIMLSNTFGVKAQEPASEPVAHSSDLTIKEIIEILSEFDVRHAEQQPFFHPAYGATAFDTTPAVSLDFQHGRSLVTEIHYRP